MKFSALAIITSTALSAETLNLKIVSDNSDLSGKGIQGLHEGGGYSYFGVSDDIGQEFYYEADQKQLYQLEPLKSFVGFFTGDNLSVGPSVSPSEVTFDSDGNLDISKQLYACKQLNDPYHYFADQFGIVGGDAPNDSCVKISLQKVGEASSSSAAPSSESSAPPTPSHGWNHTVTDQITVTGYTTYCPESTIITITTCENHACGPKTITVSEASTVVITEECVIPTTEATSEAPKPTTPITVAAESTSAKPSETPAVSSYEGAAVKNAAGVVIGFAGAAALLI